MAQRKSAPRSGSEESDFEPDQLLEVAGAARLPKFMGEASTRSWLLSKPKTGCNELAWLYYEKPVRSYLKRLGCPKQDLDDLTNDILIKLYCYILIHYDPAKRFRPYFKTAIKHAYFSFLKRNSKGDSEVREVTERYGANASDEDEDEENGIFEDGLKDYARHIYDFYSQDIPENLKIGTQMLHNWIIDGIAQNQLSKQWQMTDRNIRSCINRAADHFSKWLHRRVNPSDISELTGMAKKYGCELDKSAWDFRTLFRHASKRKRFNALLILSFVYSKMRNDPERLEDKMDRAT
jgi:DNA-directed RNA polymerase specialized sigma24 family protein